MNLRQLEVFQAVLQTGNMSAAARLLCVTPSAVSKAVAHAELQLGYRLFLRTPAGLAPTPEAQVLAAESGNSAPGISWIGAEIARAQLSHELEDEFMLYHAVTKLTPLRQDVTGADWAAQPLPFAECITAAESPAGSPPTAQALPDGRTAMS